jgi:sterol desaturase/sphingolipid hydroxylase (fatty acid hydroxylase superfamily)
MEIILYAFPLFGALLLAEFAYGRYKQQNTYHDLKDAATSLGLGLLHVALSVLVGAVLYTIDYYIFEHRIFTFGSSWYEIVVLFLIMDFSYYWWHRLSHRVRFLWANHVNHHSSEQYNFTTAFRQPLFSPILRPVFYIYIPFLGFDPEWMILVGVGQLAWSVWSHTQLIGNLGVWEYLLVTPSNHRVHHGVNPQYIDKNYGGVFIFWDILFGSYEKEKEPVVYGITHNIKTYHPAKVIFHEWWAWLKDLFQSKSFKEVFDHTFKPPGAV